jgi:hypothetical protein
MRLINTQSFFPAYSILRLLRGQFAASRREIPAKQQKPQKRPDLAKSRGNAHKRDHRKSDP